MKQKIRCLECGEFYPVMIGNVRIVGPIFSAECPFCKNKIQQNFSAFVYNQIKDGVGLATLSDAKNMIKLANNIEKIILDT